MNMQQMIAQAQKMQRQMEKALEELAKKEFSVTKNGAVTVKAYGSREIISIDIDQDLIGGDDKDMLQDMIVMAVNEVLNQINEAEEQIKSSATSGFGF